MAKKLLFAIEVDDKGTPKVKKFNKSLTTAESRTKKFSRALVKGAKSMAGMGLATGKAALKIAGLTAKMGLLAGAAGIGALLVAYMALKNVIMDILGYANEQEKVEARLAAVIKATGRAAGYSFEKMKAMAGAMQAVTTTGDEVIMSGMAILATFKNIQHDAFKKTMMAALDMSQVMDQDLKSSVVMLGKALNDPIANLSALSRAGVQFTQQQKDQIKTLWEAGSVYRAQGIILEELQAQFGGAAKAATTTFGGAMEQLANVYGDLKEELGFVITKNEYFIKLVHKVKDTVSGWIVMLNTWAQQNQALIASKVDSWLETLTGLVQKLYPIAVKTVNALTAWYARSKDIINSGFVQFLQGAVVVGNEIASVFVNVGKTIGVAAAKVANLIDKVKELSAVKAVVGFFSKASPVQPFTEGLNTITGKLQGFAATVSALKPKLVVEFEQAYEQRQTGLMKALVDREAELEAWGPAGAKGSIGIIHARVLEGQIKGLKNQIAQETQMQDSRMRILDQHAGGTNYNISLNPQIMTGTREGITTALNDIQGQMERYA